MKFKKIATVLGSALMVGSTLGFAAAAAYPAPFVQNGAADVAIVVGTAGAEASDKVAATAISTDLGSELAAQAVGGVKTVTGGESFKLEKSSNLFYFGDSLESSYSSLDKDNLDFLDDGVYNSGDVDTTTSQTIDLSAKALSLFADDDFRNEATTDGFKWTSNQNILNYTISFDDVVLFSEINGTSMPLLGKEYYVLNATQTKLTLLDSADKKVLADGETITVDGKEVSVEWIDADGVKLNVNGEITDKMSEGDAEELEDGSYVVVTEIMASTRESQTQKVEFSLGAGKVILEDGKDVIMGKDSEDAIDGLQADIDGVSTGIEGVTLIWNSYKETFLAEGSPIVMPGLGVLGLTYDGLTYPSESEMVSVENGETLTLVMDNFELPLLTYSDSGYTLGEDNAPLKTTKYGVGNFTLANGTNVTNSTATNALLLTEGDRFVATYPDTDSADAKTVYYEVTIAENDSSGNVLVELDDLIGTKDLKFEGLNEDEEADDNIVLKLVGINSTYALVNFSGSTVVFDRVYSDKGMLITLPTTSPESTMTFIEADEDGDLGVGKKFNVTVRNNTNVDKLYVELENLGNVSLVETVEGDEYTGLVVSPLASKIKTAEPTGSNSLYDFSVEYFGEEVTADVMVTVGGVVSEADSTGAVVVMDNEADKMTGKNLIVVGGNCVNSVAASLLGVSAGASCLADFTAKTGVANGQFLIQSFDKAGKTALLVAGYSAADTTKAQLYLVNQNVNTAVDAKLVGTSATEATVVTA